MKENLMTTCQIECFPGTEPPDHTRLVVGLFDTEGDAVGCWYENDQWQDVDGDTFTPQFWFEVPSVRALFADMMLTAVAEAEVEGEEGASDFS